MNVESEINLKNRYVHGGEFVGEPPLREFTEISIPVPWGYIAGKRYGPQSVRPVLAVHGWLDNAGTFDHLAALLPENLAFLAIDLPGHGLSTHLPDGCFYHNVDYLHLLRMIMDHFKWPKITFIAHSMFASVSFTFAAIFPNLVDCIINIDNLKPITMSHSDMLENFNNRVENFLREEKRKIHREEPPCYTYDELVERLYVGSYHSVEKDRCAALLARNVQLSDNNDNRYFFVRDGRIKHYNAYIGTHEFNLKMAERISCPFMFIMARQSKFLAVENLEEYKEIMKILEKNVDFTLLSCDGTHHIHLNTPENIINPVLKFLHRYATQSFETTAANTTISSKL